MVSRCLIFRQSSPRRRAPLSYDSRTGLTGNPRSIVREISSGAVHEKRVMCSVWLVESRGRREWPINSHVEFKQSQYGAFEAPLLLRRFAWTQNGSSG